MCYNLAMLPYAFLGLLAGWFINLTADYLPQRQSPLQPPRCPYCGQGRGALDWLSTLSYALLRGRCAYCHAPISLRWPMVELGTTLLFAFLRQQYAFSLQLILVTLYVCILILVFVIDLEHRLVLNVVVLPAMALAIPGSFFLPHLGLVSSLLGGLVAFGLFFLAALIYPGGMGFGDVKLAAFIGLITGFPVVLAALLIAVLMGGAIAAILLLARIRGRKSAIPYGPFLVLGGMVALFYGREIVEWYLRFYA
ncbi:MAG: prepilin peptidase [Anaerolineae bacterium]